MIAYHFTGDTLRNGEPIPAIGKVLRHKGPIIPCESGLHASTHPLGALQYAPGPILHLVELVSGYITDPETGEKTWCEIASHGDPVDKWVGPCRTILASIDATELLWYSARQFALSVAHLWDAPDVVLEYLFTGDPSLKNAARAAWDARDAAWAAWAARDVNIKQHRDFFADLVDAEFAAIQAR